MPQMIDDIFFWLDGHRLSQWGRIEEQVDEKEAIEFVPAENKRKTQLPGKAMGSLSLILQNYDAPTMALLALYDGETEVALLETLDPAADAMAFVRRVRPVRNRHHLEGTALDLRTFKLNVSSGGTQYAGKNLYPHTTNVTAPANGSTITFPALTAQQSLLVMQHVEAVSGTGNYDAKVVVDPGGVPADAHVFSQVAHTAVPDGQFALYNGPQAATTYRYEITAISGGTWNSQVAAVVIDEL